MTLSGQQHTSVKTATATSLPSPTSRVSGATQLLGAAAIVKVAAAGQRAAWKLGLSTRIETLAVEASPFTDGKGGETGSGFPCLGLLSAGLERGRGREVSER